MMTTYLVDRRRLPLGRKLDLAGRALGQDEHVRLLTADDGLVEKSVVASSVGEAVFLLDKLCMDVSIVVATTQ